MRRPNSGCALADGICDDAIGADGGEHDGERAKEADEEKGEARRRNRGGDDLVHGADVGDGERGIEAATCCRMALTSSCGSELRADGEQEIGRAVAGLT